MRPDTIEMLKEERVADKNRKDKDKHPSAAQDQVPEPKTPWRPTPRAAIERRLDEQVEKTPDLMQLTATIGDDCYAHRSTVRVPWALDVVARTTARQAH